MNIVILDDYQDAVRKLQCATKLDAYPAKVYTNTVKGIGQLSVRLKDADVVVLIRERTHMPRALIEKLPKLMLPPAASAALRSPKALVHPRPPPS
jgi:D-3-phosphoglycerate dehydrogenase